MVSWDDDGGPPPPNDSPDTEPTPQSKRPDHLRSLIQRNSTARFAVSPDDDDEEAAAAAGAADDLQDVALGDDNASPAATASPSPAALEKAKSKRLADVARRQSIYQEQAPERLVEVRLRSVSYHVPIKMDAPSVKTVANQSVCYGAYEFFRRLHQYCQRSGSSSPGEGEAADATATATAGGGGGWKAQTGSDVVLPYGTKAILQDIDLVLKPGRTYLILGPPGCGKLLFSTQKYIFLDLITYSIQPLPPSTPHPAFLFNALKGKTTLLKAIAGLLPNHKHAGSDKPHMTGRIEFNGVATEVITGGRLALAFLSSLGYRPDSYVPICI